MASENVLDMECPVPQSYTSSATTYVPWVCLISTEMLLYQLRVDRAPLEAKGNKPVFGMTFIPTLQCFPGEDSYCHTN